MTSATNSPRGGATVLQLEARKGYALGLNFLTPKDQPVDLTGCEIDIVMKRKAREYLPDEDTTNLITNSTAIIDDPLTGFARINLQATDLNVDPGEYNFVINLTTAEDYPLVAVKGFIEILNNPSTASLADVYPDALPVTSLDVILRNQSVMKIRMGNNVPPGYGYISDADQGKLDELIFAMGEGFGTAAFEDVDYFAPSAAGLPIGGSTSAFLAKVSPSDYDAAWVSPQSVVPVSGIDFTIIDHGDYSEMVWESGEGPLIDATETVAGEVIRATGGGMWGWDHVRADEIIDTATKVVMTQAERDKLESIDPGLAGADWDAESGEPGHIQNKPELGTASTHAHEDYRPADWVPGLLELADVAYGTELPTEGPPGTFFILLPEAP